MFYSLLRLAQSPGCLHWGKSQSLSSPQNFRRGSSTGSKIPLSSPMAPAKQSAPARCASLSRLTPFSPVVWLVRLVSPSWEMSSRRGRKSSKNRSRLGSAFWCRPRNQVSTPTISFTLPTNEQYSDSVVHLCTVYDLEPQKLTGIVKFIGKVDSEFIDNRIYVGLKLDEPGV